MKRLIPAILALLLPAILSAQTYQISGKVTFESTGQPIADTRIIFYKADMSYVGGIFTNDAGLYSYSGLKAGKYYAKALGTVQLSADMIVPRYVPVFHPNAASEEEAVQITVAGNVAGVNFQLSYGGGVSGRITRVWDGQPVANALIFLTDITPKAPSLTGFTDPDGRFLLSGLPKGSSGRIHLDGRIKEDKDYQSLYFPLDYPEKSATQLLVLDTVLTDINLQLSSGWISGRIVRTDNGQPISGMRVEVLNEGLNIVQPLNDAQTDDNGHYLIAGLNPGSYYVRATGEINGAPAFAPEFWQEAADAQNASLIPVDIGETKNIDFTLGEGFSISGVVRKKSDGSAIANAEMILYNSTWQSVTRTVTDKDGAYKFSGLVNTGYFLAASGIIVVQGGTPSFSYFPQYYRETTAPDQAVAIFPNGAMIGIDFYLKAQQIYTLSGNIYNTDGVLLPGPEVFIFDASWQQLLRTETGNDINGQLGKYEFSGLPAGDYYIQVIGLVRSSAGTQHKYADQYYPQTFSRSRATLFHLSENATLDFTLLLGRSISGKLLNQETGQPVNEGEILLYDVDGKAVEGQFGGVHTDAAGDFSFIGLAPQVYYLYATGRARGADNTWAQLYAASFYKNAVDWSAAEAIDLAPGNRTDIRFYLTTGLSICGTARQQSDGMPVARAQIELLNDSFNFISSLLTDDLGRYCFYAVAPGSYYVYANGTVEFLDGMRRVYSGLYYGNSYTRENAQPVQMAGAAISEIDFNLVSGGMIRGRATSSTGNPIAGMRVAARGVANWDYCVEASTDQSGDFNLVGLLPGDYYVIGTGYVRQDGQFQQLYRETFFPHASNRESAQTVTVAENGAAVADIQMLSNQGIQGRITDRAGNPIIGMRIAAHRAEDWNVVVEAYTNQFGTYYMDIPAGGNYYVVATGWVWLDGRFQQPYRETFFPRAINRESAQTVTVAQNGAAVADIQMLANQGIQGRITDSAGNPIIGMRITAHRVENWDEAVEVFTDQSGNYAMEIAVSGRYWVLATGWVWLDGQLERPYRETFFQQAGNRESAQPVNVAENVIVVADIQMLASQGIEGRITDFAGNSVSGMIIEARTVPDWNFVSQTNTDPSGRYFLSGFSAGSYYVVATGWISQGTYSDRLYCETLYPRVGDRSAAQPVVVAEGAAAVADIQMLPSYPIAGQVNRLDNGEAVNDAEIILYDSQWQRVGDARTMHQGHFSIPMPDTGQYYIKVTGNVWWNYGDYGDWKQLYHALYYPGAYQQENARPIHLLDNALHVRLYVKDITVQVEEEKVELPQTLVLEQNYPNPFNNETRIAFSLPRAGFILLQIHSLTGETVCTLLSDNREAGHHRIVWDGKTRRGQAASSGIYFYTLQYEGSVQSGKMLLLR